MDHEVTLKVVFGLVHLGLDDFLNIDKCEIITHLFLTVWAGGSTIFC